MSLAALNWAWEQECPNASAKLVLLALADKANDDGECWPGMDHIASMAGISSRQVSTHLARLEQSGMVTRKRRRMSAGKLGSYTYHLKMTSGSTLPVDTDDQRKPTSGSGPQVEADNHRKSDVVTTGSPASSPPEAHFRSEPSLEPSGNRKRAKRKPEVPLPDDWQPNEGHRELASKLGVSLGLEVDQFRDHAAANDRRQRDWDAAFRQWIRNSTKFANSRSRPEPARGPGGVSL